MTTAVFLSWHWLTRLGEAQLLLPFVLAAAAWLWRGAQQAALARRWLLAVGVAALLTTVSKLAFIGWGWGLAAWDFTGISGHSMFAAASLPMLAWVALLGRGPRAQDLGVAAAFALAALIAYSRLEVQAHSASEALAGFLLGALASLFSLHGRPRQPLLRPAVPWWLPTTLAASLLILPLIAPRSRSHDWVTQIALELSGRSQPFKRHDLHRGQHLRPASVKAVR